MSLQSVTELSFDVSAMGPIEIELSHTPLTSDTGVLPIAGFDAGGGTSWHGKFPCW